MQSNKYTNMILTVIAVFLLLIVNKIYNVPVSAYADPLQPVQEVIVTNGNYPYELRVEIVNVQDIAHELYLWRDGIPEHLTNPPILTE